MDHTTLAPCFKILTPTSEHQPSFTLKNQAHIPFIFDILSRKNHHHVAIIGSRSEAYNRVFLDLLAQQLTDSETPTILRTTAFAYLDLNRLLLTSAQPTMTQTFSELCRKLETTYPHIILAINQTEALLVDKQHPLGDQLRSLLTNHQWRIITITDQQKNLLPTSELHDLFITVNLDEFNKTDALTVLKTFRRELESFHQIIIPDEAFSYAFAMATHYLSTQQSNLDQALQLIDSGAARISIANDSEHKPVLANITLAQIVSHQTQIPLPHLQHNKLNTKEFVQQAQNHIYGQEIALNKIGLTLQHSRLKLQKKSGPLCSFLFAGPDGAGKTATAYTLAEYLFGRKSALIRVQLDKANHLDLASIDVVTEEQRRTTLFEALQQSPYAVVLFESVNQASAGILNLLENIFTDGYVTDSQGKHYDFRNTIAIITFSLAAERVTQSSTLHEMEQGDLMQLVLNNLPSQKAQAEHTSLQELGEEMRPTLETYFSSILLSTLTLIPFALLDHASLEKIMRKQLKSLAEQLKSQYDIELSYAPEVLRFLVQEAMWQKEYPTNINKALTQHLYACIQHELASNLEERNRSKRLLLQLNDAGHVLRCEFVSTNEAMLYKL